MDMIVERQNVATDNAKKPIRKRRGFLLSLLLLLLMVSGGVFAGIKFGYLPNWFEGLPKTASMLKNKLTTPTVKVVRPKKDGSATITVDQLATVEPYYQADLRARASGIVRRVKFDIGDKVRKDETLIEIDVPESEQEVAKSEAMILQREQELKVSLAKLKDAQAARDVSAATIKQRKADLDGATAIRDFKKKKVVRFQQLAAKGSVVGSIVEEEERDLLSSESAVQSAGANIEKANADLVEMDSRVEAALADIDLKKAQIEVVRKEHKRAIVVADYAKIRAPFDGIVVRRNVDPGSFVQNATTGNSDVLVSIARLDIVTISSKIPDNVAPSVQLGTMVSLQIDDLPGLTIPAKITRFAPSMQNSDRTMRVEVDLFNGNAAEYKQIEKDFAEKGPSIFKGSTDVVPIRAFPSSDYQRRLLPGMTATMKITIGKFGGSYVIPNTAIYSRSGTSYLMLTENGVTRQVPAKVYFNDGKSAMVSLIVRKRDADGNNKDILTDLTGNEEILISRQLELGDGVKVVAAPTEW